MVNALTLLSGFLQGLDRAHRLRLNCTVRIVEHLLGHGMFQRRAEQANLQAELLLFFLMVVVAADEIGDADVHGNTAGFDAGRNAKQVVDCGFVTVAAVTYSQRGLCPCVNAARWLRVLYWA